MWAGNFIRSLKCEKLPFSLMRSPSFPHAWIHDSALASAVGNTEKEQMTHAEDQRVCPVHAVSSLWGLLCISFIIPSNTLYLAIFKVEKCFNLFEEGLVLKKVDMGQGRDLAKWKKLGCQLCSCQVVSDDFLVNLSQILARLPLGSQGAWHLAFIDFQTSFFTGYHQLICSRGHEED